jgi:hypothetical protein
MRDAAGITAKPSSGDFCVASTLSGGIIRRLASAVLYFMACNLRTPQPELFRKAPESVGIEVPALM